MKRILRLFIPFLILTLFTFLVNSAYAQGWEQTYGGNTEEQAFSVIQTVDGGYATVGFRESNSSVATNVILVKTDELGNEQWTKSYGGVGDEKGYDVVQDAEGNYIIIGQTNSFGNGEDDVFLIKTNSKGQELWAKNFGGAYIDKGWALTISNNGDYLITGEIESEIDRSTNVYLIRTDEDGNLLWEKNFGGSDTDFGRSVIETKDGDIVIVGQNKSYATPSLSSPNFRPADIYFIKTNASGEILEEHTYGNIEQDIAFDVVETQDGNFALTGSKNDENQLCILLLNSKGEELWSKSYGGIYTEIGYSIANTADRGFIVAGVKEINTTTSQSYLLKTDNQGNLEWDRLFGNAGLDDARSVIFTSDGGYLIAGSFDINNDPDRIDIFSSIHDFYLVKTDGTGSVFKNTIKGTVHRDMNTNCEKDGDEKVLEDWLVKIKKGNETLYATTDKNGYYEITVKNGNYNVGLVVLNTAWEVCQNYNVAFSESDTMQLDFAARSTVEDCPVLVVDVSTALLEPCQAADYTINLCNRGIEKAEEVYIDVQFDPFLTVNYSTLPWTNHIGNIYRFDIGDLVVEECGSFIVNTTVSCDAVVGQAHCVEAYAHPDPICIPPHPLWDGASIKVDGECKGDSVQFIIKNIGGGNMGSPLGFVVIEDVIIFRQGDFQLPSSASDTFYIPTKTNISSYRIIAEQPSGHPYGQTASAAVEGCPFGQPFNTGFLTTFSDADALPFFSLDCQENKIIAGNADLTPSPKGVGNFNSIAKTDELEYHIYFQNTGSDTVDQVIIRDTLSPYLEITTIVPGASSHQYDFEVSGTGVLKFTFHNIKLLSESTRASQSYGFVKFKVSQKANNLTGMVIENKAVVHFDFGVPIFTNPTFHTIGGESVEDFVEISTDVETVFVPNVEVKIMPNPFGASGTTIELVGLEDIREVQFDLYDIAGRSIQRQTFNSHKFQFYPNDLAQGLYIYTIRAKGTLINSGKVFIR